MLRLSLLLGRTLLRVFGWTLALALFGVTLAQTGMPSMDPKVLGASPWSLGAAVFFLMSSLKRWADQNGKTLSPWFWRGMALLIGVAGAFCLYVAHYGAELVVGNLAFPYTVLLFGLLSGAFGAGYRDALKTAFSWLATARPPIVVPNLPFMPMQAPDEILPPAGVIRENPARAA